MTATQIEKLTTIVKVINDAPLPYDARVEIALLVMEILAEELRGKETGDSPKRADSEMGEQ
jgi:hypothetical protein